jgi:hypothetical protein
MVLSAWDLTIRMRQWSIQRSVANALNAATAAHEAIDIVRIATSVTERLQPAQRALVLSYVARLLTDNGQNEKALDLLLLALESARLAGRDTVLEVLANGAGTLAAVDDGELLLRIAQQFDTIDGWFSAA